MFEFIYLIDWKASGILPPYHLFHCAQVLRADIRAKMKRLKIAALKKKKKEEVVYVKLEKR